MSRIFHRLLSIAVAASALSAQTVYLPVDAPFAQAIVASVKNAHAELRKLGVHAIPPGARDYAIIASNFPSKIGKKSSDADLAVIRSGIPSVKRDSISTP